MQSHPYPTTALATAAAAVGASGTLALVADAVARATRSARWAHLAVADLGAADIKAGVAALSGALDDLGISHDSLIDDSGCAHFWAVADCGEYDVWHLTLTDIELPF